MSSDTSPRLMLTKVNHVFDCTMYESDYENIMAAYVRTERWEEIKKITNDTAKQLHDRIANVNKIITKLDEFSLCSPKLFVALCEYHERFEVKPIIRKKLSKSDQAVLIFRRLAVLRHALIIAIFHRNQPLTGKKIVRSVPSIRFVDFFGSLLPNRVEREELGDTIELINQAILTKASAITIWLIAIRGVFFAHLHTLLYFYVNFEMHIRSYFRNY